MQNVPLSVDGGPQRPGNIRLCGPGSELRSFLTLGQKGNGEDACQASFGSVAFIKALEIFGILPLLAPLHTHYADKDESFLWARTEHSRLRLGDDSPLFRMVTQSLLTLLLGHAEALFWCCNCEEQVLEQDRAGH